MSYAANDVWVQWADTGAGATVSVSNGILNIIDPSNATNGSKYIQLTARGGDKIVFRTMARAISGAGRLWINLGSIGGTVVGEVPITGNAEFDSYAIECVIPHTQAAVDVFIGIGCTTADVGTIEAYAPTVYLNGTAVDFLMGYAGVASKSGRLGIGIFDPAYKLHVSGGGNPSVGVSYYENGSGGAAYIGVKYRGTQSVPAAVLSGDFLSSLLASAYTGTGTAITGNIGLAGFLAAENITGSAQGTDFVIGTTPIGSTSRAERLRVRNNGNVRPGTDNTQSLGEAALRWSVVFAGTGTINTSDENEKDHIQDIDAAALRAVRNIDFKQFKFKDAIAEKGDNARWHFGAIAQQVKQAFEAESIDPFAFGILCYDEWEEETEVLNEETGEVLTPYRPAGFRYGVRYDELLCLKLAAMESA